MSLCNEILTAPKARLHYLLLCFLIVIDLKIFRNKCSFLFSRLVLLKSFKTKPGDSLCHSFMHKILNKPRANLTENLTNYTRSREAENKIISVILFIFLNNWQPLSYFGNGVHISR